MVRKSLDPPSRTSSFPRSRFRLRCNIPDLCRSMLYHQVRRRTIFCFPRAVETYAAPLIVLSQLQRLRANLVDLKHKRVALFLILSLGNLFCVDHYEIISYYLDICIKSEFFHQISQSFWSEIFTRYYWIVLYELP